MAKKKYIIKSSNQYIHTFSMDKLTARVAFELNSTGQQCEALVTDVRTQFLIENSNLFKSGFISLSAEYKNDSDSKNDSGKLSVGNEPTIFDTEEREGVMTALKEAGKKPTTFSGIVKAIEALNYNFPNIDFGAWEADFGN